jgi:putative ABC transport system permease protein
VTIGRGLSEALNLKLGDEATLIAQTVGGSINGIDIVIRGIVDVPLPSFSKRIVYLNINHARRLIRLDNRHTEVAIRLKNQNNIETWVAKNKPIYAANQSELRGWWEIQPVIKEVERIADSVLGAVGFLLFLSAALSVLNIIFMLVSERTVEIGTLMALGAKSIDIRRLFTLEASLIGVLGGLIGVIVGNFAVVIVDIIGVPFKSPFGSSYVVAHPKMDFWVSLAVFLVGVLICYLAAIAPSRKASSVEPVKAFRGQLT